jgi:hypothetical protein
MKRRITIQDAVELGLNVLAQDLVYKSHTEEDIQDYINQFEFRLD